MNTRTLSIIWLLAFSLSLQAQNVETEQSLGFVVIHPMDSVLSLDPMSPDSFVIVEPGRLFALKGDMEVVHFSYSDGRPTEVHEFYNVRYAGKITPPEFPMPPIGKLPRREDGWLSSSKFLPRAVSFAPLAETMEVVYPFFMVEAIEGTDFYGVFDQKSSGLTDDLAKRSIDARRFKLPFEKGTEQIIATDSIKIQGRDTLILKTKYLGQFQNFGYYLLEKELGKRKWHEYISKKDGSISRKIEFPVSMPTFSAGDQWLTTVHSSADGMIFYIQFHQKDEETQQLIEKFTVRIPLQKPTDVVWESENILLMRIEQTGSIADSRDAEKFYRVFITINN